jgi:cell division protein ZapA
VKQLDVTILGQSYVLVCPEGGEARLRAAAAQVDREIATIRDKGKVKSRERIAVLAALNLVYEASDQGSASTPQAAVSSESTPAIDALILRLDRALSDDGQLL